MAIFNSKLLVHQRVPVLSSTHAVKPCQTGDLNRAGLSGSREKPSWGSVKASHHRLSLLLLDQGLGHFDPEQSMEDRTMGFWSPNILGSYGGIVIACYVRKVMEVHPSRDSTSRCWSIPRYRKPLRGHMPAAHLLLFAHDPRLGSRNNPVALEN